MARDSANKKTLPKSLLKNVAKDNPPSRFLDYKDFFHTVFDRLKRIDPSYTYERFSRDLGFEVPGAAYVMLKGLRKLSQEKMSAACVALRLSVAETKYLQWLVVYTDSDSAREKKEAFQNLLELRTKGLTSERERQLLNFFSSWHHSAIFELAGLEDFSSDSGWISAKLHNLISEEKVRRSLELLEQLGYLKYDDQLGRHVKSTRSITMGDETADMAVIGYHLQMMELGQQSLSRFHHTEREIGALTIAVSEKVASRLKEDVVLFKNYVKFLADQCDEPKQVVQLNLQLFPLSRGGTP